VSAKNYEWYRGSETNIRDTARKLAEFLNAPAGTVVHNTSGLDLEPW